MDLTVDDESYYRELEKPTAATRTATSLNKKSNKQYNGCARSLQNNNANSTTASNPESQMILVIK